MPISRLRTRTARAAPRTGRRRLVRDTAAVALSSALALVTAVPAQAHEGHPGHAPTPGTAAPTGPYGQGWRDLTPIAGGPRQEHAVAALANDVYVLGGIVPDGAGSYVTTGRVEVYDTRRRMWTDAAPIPVAMNHPNVAAVDGEIYVIGALEGGAADRAPPFRRHGVTSRCYDPLVPRWQSHTQERLVRAALELYAEQGYERTTVRDIADRVGVTARTYFRYFPDKREVLFASGQAVREAIVAATSEALRSQPPHYAVLTGAKAGRAVFLDRDFVRTRDAVIATSEELRERELLKTAGIAAELTAVLSDAGCEEATARMTAEAGLAVFLEATRRWTAGDDTPFEELVDQSAQLLRETASRIGEAAR